jgi:Ala-tRNA(Pro) deacylase
MRIQDYLSQRGVEFQTHQHAPVYTAQEVAAEEHISGRLLAKTVVVRADEQFALCVLPASMKLDMEKVASATGARSIRLADENEMARLFPDVEIGAEPPFGNLYDLTTYVDGALQGDAEIVFQAGSHREAIRMRFSDYEELVQPIIADLSVRM